MNDLDTLGGVDPWNGRFASFLVAQRPDLDAETARDIGRLFRSRSSKLAPKDAVERFLRLVKQGNLTIAEAHTILTTAWKNDAAASSVGGFDDGDSL